MNDLIGGLLALMSVIVMNRLDNSTMTTSGDGEVSISDGLRHAYIIWAVALARCRRLWAMAQAPLSTFSSRRGDMKNLLKSAILVSPPPCRLL